MKRIMILALAPLIALALAGAAMIGVTLAITGDGGDAVSPGDIGIAETATGHSERFTVGVDACWIKSGSATRESAAGPDESYSATEAQPLAEWSTYIRICNFEDEVSVTVNTAGDRERILVGETDCWAQTTHLRLGWIAPPSVIGRATRAEMPGGWWDARWTESTRFCNFEGDITVTVEESGSSQWIPNVLPPDAIAA